MGTKFNPFTGRLQWIFDGDLIVFKDGVASSINLPPTGNDKNDARFVEDTSHLWIWNGTQWIDQGDLLAYTWDAMTGKPSSSPANIDDAVTKKHVQNTDTKLDEGGANEKLVEDLIISENNGDLRKITKLQYNKVTGEILVFYEE